MKTIKMIVLSLMFYNIYAQDIKEQDVKTVVNEVTVFLEGAQITRHKTINLPQGKTIVKFVNLSPFIDAKSIQVKATGELTVLSVNHQQNYLNKLDKPAQLQALQNDLEALDDEIKVESTYLSIIKEELVFLQENRNIGGKNEVVSVTNLQQASDFYGAKLTALKLKEIERQKTLKTLNAKRSDIQEQMRTLSSEKEFASGEILVKVDVAEGNNFPMELSYVVGNAGWFPTYDIRAKNITEPVQLVYKANVRQDTKVDWVNAKLKFSSADPNISGLAPELKTYFLNYHTAAPTYRSTTQNSVSGRVSDSEGLPIAYASVYVDGTTIGTVTDVDGNYSITIPNNADLLKFSFIGYDAQTLPIRGSSMYVTLQESNAVLEEVVAVDMLQGRVAGVQIRGARTKRKGSSSKAMPVAQVQNQTTVDFEIETPYTIQSDNKNYVVDMVHYDLPASYQYYCVPKVDDDAFLIAHIIDWEQYNLLEGEANVFFEDTYVGRTLLDVRYASDTLEISLGRDKQVSVSREKLTDLSNRQFIGSKKEVTRAYQTTVRNNKAQSINMIVLDQIPVSTENEIEVEVKNVSGAKHDVESGEIKWEFNLDPSATQAFDLKYSVKYPKDRALVIE